MFESWSLKFEWECKARLKLMLDMKQALTKVGYCHDLESFYTTYNRNKDSGVSHLSLFSHIC